MGNTLCACVTRRPDQINEVEKSIFVQHLIPRPSTPYDNELNAKVEESFILEPSSFTSDNDTSMSTIAEPVIKEQHHRPENTYHHIRSQSNVDSGRVTSVFRIEETSDNESLSNVVNTEIYEIILREVLITHFPLNNTIINAMISKNVLLPEDAQILLSKTHDSEKLSTFLNNFVFSEVNLCKLATFLHVLINSQFHTLTEFRRDERFFQSIVDHIYYVINVLSLFTECFRKQDRKLMRIYLSNIVSIVCSNRAANFSTIPFYARVYLSGIVIPELFCKNFACINEHFHCCQELTLSSCDLKPVDVLNLCQGFRFSETLRDLDISSNPIGDEGLKYLEDLFRSKNYLKSLNIACCSLTARGIEQFLETITTGSSTAALSRLNIGHNKLEMMQLSHVLMLTKLQLNCLEMRSIDLKSQGVLFESLKLNDSLDEIDISGNKLVSNDIKYLAAGLAYNFSLRKVSMVKMGLTKSDCLVINNTFLMNKTIVSIDLSDNIIGDEGADILKDILTMKESLKELYLKRCGISLNGALVLLRKATEMECNLNVIDLCYNHCPRMSIVVDVRDNIRKIHDLIHHITLVKDIRILLWGTLDEPLSFHSDCIEF